MVYIKEICLVMLFGILCAFGGYWCGINAGPTGSIESAFRECETATDTVAENLGKRQSDYTQLKQLTEKERELYSRLGGNCEARQRINNNLGRELDACEKILQEITNGGSGVQNNNSVSNSVYVGSGTN